MTDIFNKLELEAFKAGITPRTKESIAWFRKKAQSMRNVNRSALMKDETLELGNKPIVGNMFMFFYDPKTKDTLPYYDSFPLTIIVGKSPGGFTGLNLHYLPPILRAKMLDGLVEITNNSKYDETTRFQVKYSMLQKASSLKYFKPCFKRYLTAHTRSRFAYVPPPEWEIATFLPTADFQKAGRSTVYAESRKAIS